MQCAHCGNEVPARPSCLQCGAPLLDGAALPAPLQAPVRIPLTGRQKLRLLGDCWTFVLFTAIAFFFVMAVQRGITPAPPGLTYVLLAALVLYTAYGAVQSLRDVKSGIALAQEDLLVRSLRRRRRRGGYGVPFGYFEQLGALRMPVEVYSQNSAGRRYRVIYSPLSKRVWALESLKSSGPGLPEGQIGGT